MSVIKNNDTQTPLWKIFITVFSVGFSSMCLEIVGIRIMAPDFGNSIIVWTIIIGVILTFLSLGYVKGGILADQKVSIKTYSLLLITASFVMATIPLVQYFLLSAISTNFELIPGALISALIIFGPINFILGMAFPYAIEIVISQKSTKKTGLIMGKMFAISTLGNVSGVFVTGFLLIPIFGVKTIIFGLSSILFFCSFLTYYNPKKLFLLPIITIIMLTGSVLRNNSLLIETDTLYNHVSILSALDFRTKRPVLKLITGKNEVQSSMFLDSNSDYPDEYKKYFRLVSAFNPNFKNVLMIGGGAYTSPKDFLNLYQNAKITVVEIDPGLTKIAQKYFDLKPNQNLEIVHKDARQFLNKEEKGKYDLVILDAFQNNVAPPFQLTSIEALNKINNVLNKNGTVFMNIVGAPKGPGSNFLNSEISTFQKIFPNVYIIPVQNPDDLESIKNNILIAKKGDFDLTDLKNKQAFAKELKYIYTPQKNYKQNYLTDNFAPVEQQLLNIYKYINR